MKKMSGRSNMLMANLFIVALALIGWVIATLFILLIAG